MAVGLLSWHVARDATLGSAAAVELPAWWAPEGGCWQAAKGLAQPCPAGPGATPSPTHCPPTAGLLIIKQGGDIAYSYAEKTFGDHAPMEEVLAAAKKAGGKQ